MSLLELEVPVSHCNIEVVALWTLPFNDIDVVSDQIVVGVDLELELTVLVAVGDEHFDEAIHVTTVAALLVYSDHLRQLNAWYIQMYSESKSYFFWLIMLKSLSFSTE